MWQVLNMHLFDDVLQTLHRKIFYTDSEVFSTCFSLPVDTLQTYTLLAEQGIY